MPVYDYTCEPCKLTFEASRSFKDSDVPADCPLCDKPAIRQLSVPTAIYTKGAAFDSLRSNPAPGAGGRTGGSNWYHHGHSHGSGSKSHSH